MFLSQQLCAHLSIYIFFHNENQEFAVQKSELSTTNGKWKRERHGKDRGSIVQQIWELQGNITYTSL